MNFSKVLKPYINKPCTLQTLTTPKPQSRKTSLAEVIPDWPELKPYRKPKQVPASKVSLT